MCHAGRRGVAPAEHGAAVGDTVRAGQRPGAEGLVCRPGSVPGVLAVLRSATIHLGPPLPAASCGPPAHSGGQPSDVRCSTLLRAGFAEPTRSPGSLVVSCTTVSPLPERAQAVCSLWHCPAGCPGWVLPTALPFGARTFLGVRLSTSAAVARPAPPRRHRRPRDGETPGRALWEAADPAFLWGCQLTFRAVSSMTNDVWREESSVPLNEIVTVCPAKEERLNDRW